MRHLACLMTVAAAAAVMTPQTAEACGGCFHAPAPPPTYTGPQESTVVTGHRMALSVSKEETVLWDQIRYSGDPQDFAWVLPVKPGAVIEVATDAWFDVLEAATATVITPPPIWCGGDDGYYGGGSSSFGCGSDAVLEADSSSGGELATPPPDPVQVVHEGTAGPYETVTLSTDQPGALNDWLTDNGYSAPEEMQPIIDAYVAEGFDFIALRLQPNQGTTAMKPVRVRTPGASFALPLRMVAAGTGVNTAMTLYMITEGRYEVANFSNEQVDMDKLVWDFDGVGSNYAELRLRTLKRGDGLNWLTTYARQGSLLSTVPDPVLPGANVAYGLSDGTRVPTIAEAYVRQGVLNGESQDTSCVAQLQALGSSNLSVVADCDDGGCASDTIPAAGLTCEGLDDVAVALTGKVARDVWVTRFEAELPRSAFDQDLALTGARNQTVVDNRIESIEFENGPCASTTTASIGLPSSNKNKTRRLPGGLVALSLAGIGLAYGLRRRREHELASE